MKITRRELIQSAASSATLSCVGVAAWSQNTPVRVSIDKFSADKARVAQFRTLFSEMRKRKASDPASYFFQGAIHWFPDLGDASVAKRPDLKVLSNMFNADPAAKQMLNFWNQCTHMGKKTPGDFLLWHRAYLYYFEQHARRTLGDLTFAVPYWDYRDTTTSRQLPSIFLSEKVDGQENSLYPRGGLRRALASIVDSLDSGDVDIANVMANDYYFSEPGIEGMGDSIGLGTAIDAVPHGSVHGGIGGWMGSVSTAAFDPVFWVHHANIDRIFNQWLTKKRYWSRTMTTQEITAWLAVAGYSFYDANGKLDSKPRSFYLDQKNLGYVYDTDPVMIIPPTLPQQPAVVAQAAVGNNPMGIAKEIKGFNEKSAGSLLQAVKVPAASGVVVRVPLTMPAATPGIPKGNAALAITNQSNNNNNRTFLYLSDVKKAGELGGNYGVFVGPGAEAAKDSLNPAFVRRFSSFEAPEDGFSGPGATYRFDITRQIRNLGVQVENLVVRIVPMPKSTQIGGVDGPGALVVNKVEIKSAIASTDPLK